MQLKMQI